MCTTGRCHTTPRLFHRHIQLLQFVNIPIQFTVKLNNLCNYVFFKGTNCISIFYVQICVSTDQQNIMILQYWIPSFCWLIMNTSVFNFVGLWLLTGCFYVHVNILIPIFYLTCIINKTKEEKCILNCAWSKFRCIVMCSTAI